MTKHLIETGKLDPKPKSPGVYRVRLITEGKGSSGTYSRELLKEYGDALNNRGGFLNHPIDPEKPWERDVNMLAVRYGKVDYEVHEDVAALYTDMTVRSEYQGFIEQFGDLIGLSIYILGDGADDENGEYQVKSFDREDPYASIDLVVAAGRGGRIERAVESVRNIETSLGNTKGDEKKEIEMDEATFRALFAELLKPVVEKLDSTVALVESLKGQPAEVENVVKATTELDEALVEAKLPKTARARVIEAVISRGVDLTAAIKAEQDARDAILSEYDIKVNDSGVVHLSESNTTTPYKSPWKRV